MPVDDLRIARLEAAVEKHSHLLLGNGEPSVGELLRANTRHLADLDDRVEGLGGDVTALSARMDKSLTEVRQSVDALRAERKADHDKSVGRRELYGWVKFALGIVGVLIGIAVGFAQLNEQWAQVEDLIRRLPPIPE